LVDVTFSEQYLYPTDSLTVISTSKCRMIRYKNWTSLCVHGHKWVLWGRVCFSKQSQHE